MKNKKRQKNLRHSRVKKSIKLTRPRLVVFRSNKYIYGQIIDDASSKTLIAASDNKNKKSKNKIESAKEVGINLAKESLKKNIKNIVFDRAGYKYHGRVKALAEGAREGGLVF